MEEKDVREIAMIAAVMGKEIYDEARDVARWTVDAYDLIAEASIEFYREFKYVRWSRLKEEENFHKEIGIPDLQDWDEVISWYGKKFFNESKRKS